MTEHPIASYRVNTSMLWPIAAAVGQLLVVWPGHPTHTLAVVRRTRGHAVVRHAHMPEGALYGVIMNLELDGHLTPLSPADAQRFAWWRAASPRRAHGHFPS